MSVIRLSTKVIRFIFRRLFWKMYTSSYVWRLIRQCFKTLISSNDTSGIRTKAFRYTFLHSYFQSRSVTCFLRRVLFSFIPNFLFKTPRNASWPTSHYKSYAFLLTGSTRFTHVRPPQPPRALCRNEGHVITLTPVSFHIHPFFIFPRSRFFDSVRGRPLNLQKSAEGRREPQNEPRMEEYVPVWEPL